MNIHEMRKRVRAKLHQAATPQQRRGSWYEIKATADDTAVIRIYEEISDWWGISAESFARELALVTAAKIEVQINSPGGDVFDGIAIYNALRAHPAHVTTRVDGLAASAASIISQAGDHRVMLSSSTMMIHEAWGVAIGPAAEMRAYADLLDQINDTAAALYASRAGGDAAEFRQLMSEETWLTDARTVELGLADEVIDLGKQENDDPDAEPPADGAELRNAMAALLADPDFRQQHGLPPAAPAGEREEEAPAEAPVVARDQADSLFASLTLRGRDA